MSLYTVTLEQFHIDTTRSRDDDTDTVGFGLKVGKRSFPVQSDFSGTQYLERAFDLVQGSDP